MFSLGFQIVTLHSAYLKIKVASPHFQQSKITAPLPVPKHTRSHLRSFRRYLLNAYCWVNKIDKYPVPMKFCLFARSSIIWTLPGSSNGFCMDCCYFSFLSQKHAVLILASAFSAFYLYQSPLYPVTTYPSLRLKSRENLLMCVTKLSRNRINLSDRLDPRD